MDAAERADEVGSLKFDKEANKSHLYIDFVWVVPEMRGRRIG